MGMMVEYHRSNRHCKERREILDWYISRKISIKSMGPQAASPSRILVVEKGMLKRLCCLMAKPKTGKRIFVNIFVSINIASSITIT